MIKGSSTGIIPIQPKNKKLDRNNQNTILWSGLKDRERFIPR